MKWAVINSDDPKGTELINLTDANVVTYGLERGCDFRAEGVQVTRNGLTAKLISPIGEVEIKSSLIGGLHQTPKGQRVGTHHKSKIHSIGD